MPDFILSSLNPRQKDAVSVLSGPLLILAGAGSGKTKVLTHRIANLIGNGVLPNEILAVTFTNKAAKEMEGRIDKLLAKSVSKIPFASPSVISGGKSRPSVGTFHATCVRILRADIENINMGLNSNFVIFDTGDTQSLMKIIMKEKCIDEKEFRLRAVLSHISDAKNQLLPSREYEDSVEVNKFTKVIKILYPVYQKRLREHNALDFDDLLQKTVELFERCPEVLEKYRNKWSHLLVDEYQDTNFAQYRFVRLLADKHQNLCVVGDDHQSIYSFRGADYRNILEFEKDFSHAKVIKLEQNYRSTSNILENANCLIRHNETGREKNLWTDNCEGERVSVIEVIDEKDEGRLITEKIHDLMELDDTRYSDFAVLYRMNAQSRVLEESFMRNQIPYQIIGGTRFFDRKEIKEVIAYLRLIFNSRDDVSFLRIINIPSRKLGKTSVDILWKYAENYSMSLFEVLSAVDEIEELSESKKAILKEFQKLISDLQVIIRIEPISILLDKLIKKIEFYKFLEDGTPEGEARIQNVRELFSVATKYDSAENSLAAFLEGVALISDLDNHDSSVDCVTLMTIHASKGLEFPVIFLPGWEEGIFPSSNTQFSFEGLEEERRLAYVALTRAEKKCFIFHARQRMLFGKTDYSSPSKFLGEMNDECIDKQSFSGDSGIYGRSRGMSKISSLDSLRQPKTRSEAIFGIPGNETEYAISDRICHAEFGEGTVIQISGDVLTVAFSGKGIQKIVASVAPIEKVGNEV